MYLFYSTYDYFCFKRWWLKLYKDNRDNNSVKMRLNELKTLAKSNNNIMPGLIKCVHSKCTLGEMSDTLREVFGDYSL